MSQKLVYTNDVSAALHAVITEMLPDRVFVVCDRNTCREVLPNVDVMAGMNVLTMDSGDDAKNLDSLSAIWAGLTDGGATRRSLVINLGGGVVTDLGGFAAATFKRGVRFINVPTTLLAAVDAAVGGKTGINFLGLKNEIGVFAKAEAVVVSSRFFRTLPHEELMSGYAEMLKHGLLSGVDDIARLLERDPGDFNENEMLDLLKRSIAVKEGIVERDPMEKGERKVLNLGHTVGHALESLAMRRARPVPHGYAVAWGMIAELVLSHMRLGLDSNWLYRMGSYVEENYGAPAIGCDDYEGLLELMGHDKKNAHAGTVNFTLLRSPGQPVYDCEITDLTDITSAIDIMRDLLHC